MNFKSLVDPPATVLDAISACAPHNPFLTAAYARAVAESGRRPVAMWLERESDASSPGGVGFLAGTVLGRELELTSMTEISAEPFWEGVLETCGALGVVDLVIYGYGGTAVEIPAMAKERWRRERCEHWVDLDCDDALERCSKNHRRNIRRGQSAGLTIRSGADRELCESHVELVNDSRRRRSARGESVGELEVVDRMWPMPRAGAGVFYQACDGERPVSSIFVLRSDRGAYYQSAGTSEEGRKTGASHFLVYRVLETLRGEGLPHFNLAGAGADEIGLMRFKTGFGTRPVDLQAVAFDLAGTARRGLIDSVRWARRRFRAGP